MKKLKHIASLLLAGVLVFGAAGCGSKEAEKPAETPAAGGGKQTINILMEAVPDTDYVMAQLDKFTEATGIKVNVEVINYSSMHEKLLTQMLSKTNAYDVIVVDCYWTGEFTTAGWLTDLGPYIEASGMDTGVYAPSMMEMVGEVDGVTYQLPFYNYMLALVYRTDVVEQIPATLDEYVEMCKQITADNNGEIYGAVMQGLRPDPIAMEWMNYLFTCGGDFCDEAGNIAINSPEAVHALELYVDNMKNAAPEGAPSYGFDEAFNVFAQGDAATYITYNWMLPKLDNADESSVSGKVDIAPLPNGVSLNAGWGWAIPHNAEDKETSWKFLEWVESFDIAKERALAGGSPTRSDVMTDADVLAKYPHLETVNEIMLKSRIIPVIADAPQLVEVLGRELSEAVIGSKTPQQALDTVAEEMANMK